MNNLTGPDDQIWVVVALLVPAAVILLVAMIERSWRARIKWRDRH